MRIVRFMIFSSVSLLNKVGNFHETRMNIMQFGGCISLMHFVLVRLIICAFLFNQTFVSESFDA